MVELFFKKGTILPTHEGTTARLAQLVEQRIYTAKVGSSNLSSRTIRKPPLAVFLMRDEVIVLTHYYVRFEKLLR